MATRRVQTAQAQQAVVTTTGAPVQGHGSQLTVELPTSITLKDVVVIATALVSIVSSWTFYTMRLSVLEQKITESKVQLDKSNDEIDSVKKDLQDLKLREQAVEIRLQYKR